VACEKNLLIQGTPGVGKTFVARRLAHLLIGHRDLARTRMVQFYQAYAYEDFIQGFRPSDEGGFTRRDGAFFDFAKLAEADPGQPYVFIIDEINRGDISKILGELMMLIEADKRGPEYALPLAYGRPDEPLFSVPPNLFLLGLMNTASPRCDHPKFGRFLEQRGASRDLISPIVSRMGALNAKIAAGKVLLGPGYQIGHSFFAPSGAAHEFNLSWYRRVIRSEVAPLLEEYWFDDSEKVEIWTAKLLEGTN
jgi:5-methylcytosine-specific restriction enzyme B